MFSMQWPSQVGCSLGTSLWSWSCYTTKLGLLPGILLGGYSGFAFCCCSTLYVRRHNDEVMQLLCESCGVIGHVLCSLLGESTKQKVSGQMYLHFWVSSNPESDPPSPPTIQGGYPQMLYTECTANWASSLAVLWRLLLTPGVIGHKALLFLHTALAEQVVVSCNMSPIAHYWIPHKDSGPALVLFSGLIGMSIILPLNFPSPA